MTNAQKKQRSSTQARAGLPSVQPAWPEQAEPSLDQRAAIEQAKTRRAARRPAVPVAARRDGSVVQVGFTSTDQAGASDRLFDVAGSRSAEWIDGLTMALANVMGGTAGPAVLVEGLAFLNGIAPRDEPEAAFGAQMFAVHKSMMEVARRMNGADDRLMFMDYAKALTRFGGLYTRQMEALAKIRSGGRQQVEVKHVYVDNRGGNAVIGEVHHNGGGARGGEPNSQQPHAIGFDGGALAPGGEVWGADALGFALPFPGGEGAEALPNARREESGGSRGEGKRQLPARSKDAQSRRVAPAGHGPGSNLKGDAQ